MLGDEDYPFESEDFKYETHHLPKFDVFDKAISLYGKPYLPLKKALIYSILGAILRKRITVVGKEIDTRLNPAICISSGQGKKNVARIIKEICNELGLKYASPASLYPEQLIGTSLEEKDKTGRPYENRGHLDENYLVMDEAIRLIKSNDPMIEVSRSYINIALDTMGQNEVNKRLTKDKRGEGVSFEPDVTICMLFQPFVVEDKVVVVGFMKRFLALYIKISEEDMDFAYEKSVYGDPDREPSVKEFCEFLKDFQEKRFVGRISTKETKDRIRQLHKELIKQGYGFSQKGKNYTKIFGHSLLDILSKMAYILACVEDSEIIEVRHVDLAYADLVEIFASTLEWIDVKTEGNLDYGESQNVASEIDIICLNRLRERKNDHVRIQEYIDEIREIRGVGPSQAAKIYRKYVRRGWIGRKQIGKNDSKVWFIKMPPQGDQGFKGDPINRPTEYEKIVEKYSPPKG